MIKRRHILFPVILILLLAGCGWPENKADDNESRGERYIQKSSPLGNWSLQIPEGPYAFTDRIPLELTLDFDEIRSISALSPAADVWGDFRVRHLIRKGSTFEAEVIPRKTGESRLIIPLIKSSDHKENTDVADSPLYALDPDWQLMIESVLQEGEQEAASLLTETEKSGNAVLIVFSSCLLVAAGVAAFFLYRRHRRQKDTTAEVLSLRTFLENQKTLEDIQGSCESITGFYRTVFQLLLEELEKLHPAVAGKGYGPVELMNVLEEPSSLNQWNLRSLYPLLDKMEHLFFNSECHLPDESEYQKDRNLLLAWMTVSKEESGEI